MNQDFDGSLRARDGGWLLGQDPPAVAFEGVCRDGDGRRDLVGLVGQGGTDGDRGTLLVARAEPDGDVGGFQGVVDDAGQVGADGVEVNGVLQAGGEREMIRSISYSRYFRIPMPMLSGSAANPRISTSQIEELVLTAEMPSTPQTAAPLASHFSC